MIVKIMLVICGIPSLSADIFLGYPRATAIVGGCCKEERGMDTVAEGAADNVALAAFLVALLGILEGTSSCGSACLFLEGFCGFVTSTTSFGILNSSCSKAGPSFSISFYLSQLGFLLPGL